jgi:RNA polymerase sigma-70 factor (ECF subfamily)
VRDDELELVRRCLAGEQAAVSALVETFRGAVFGLCYRMLNHRQDAEDVTQESFVRALRSLARFDLSRDFKPWLLAIAGNRCRTLLSTRKHRPSSAMPIEGVEDSAPNLEGAKHLAEEVDLVLSGMREEYRQAFSLFHEEQLSYVEIGEALGCPVGTVKTWVHRARKELAAALIERGVVEDQRHEPRGV